MASEEWKDCLPDPNSCYLQKFRLYETRSKFYMIGRDKNRTCWRVLKIERLEPSELNILEDSKTYSEFECFDLLRRLHEGNRSTGGLKFVTACYGIVGFIKFLGPYYMLLITKRKQIGVICGHAIYAVSKSVMIPVPHSSVQCSMAYSNNEKRYKKLLSTVDLTKDFFFSYSYHIMHSLQKNLCNNGTGQSHYETMFVWNEFLTRGIRNSLKNTSWTVALVYGFFKQVQLSVSGKKVKFTLIARRSRHYAGTRYLKRGVNEKGRVANDVETEQIVIENVPDGCPVQISSVVQNRGSIPLFWSQETSRLNIKPDIILSKKDQKYEATKLHFENLVKRYGNPIIILNLIKTREKKPRETVLGPEFANAVQLINRSLPREYRLRFLHWDLQKYSKNRATNALTHLCKVTGSALNITGIFYCQLTPNLRPEGLENLNCFDQSGDDCTLQNQSPRNEAGENVEIEVSDGSHKESASPCIKTPLLQKGVLRTNCIDCLDRTNVAQYCYGLVALGRQLYIVGILGSPNIDLYNPLAEELMKMYEIMGDTLAFQYGGSAAHNKIFCETRGQWKATTHSQEFIRSFQRYYSNAYADAEKQDAINVFLGYFQPQLGKVALWELGSDQHYNVERHDPNFVDDNTRSSFKRSLSDGNFPCESDDSSLASSKVGLSQPEKAQECNRGLSESTPEITSCGTDISYSRYTPSMSSSKLFINTEEDHYFERDHICYEEHGEACNCSNFLDMDWVSSSGNSCEEDMFDRSVGSDSAYSIKGREQTGTKLPGDDVLLEYNESFMNWVMNEVMLSR